jgi:hypothetical protein
MQYGMKSRRNDAALLSASFSVEIEAAVRF